MSKTIKQIADELYVSKQAVYKKIKSAPLSTDLQKFMKTVDRVIYISDDGEKLIKSTFSKTDRQPVVDNQESTGLQSCLRLLEKQNEQLSRELEIKNKQIDDLSSALVLAQETAKAAQALHAGTIQQQLTDGKEKEKKRWQFWKNSKE